MAIPSLAEEIRAYIHFGELPPPKPGDVATLDYALERWAKRAATLAQIRDELRAEATVANKLAQQYLRWWQDEAEMCQKLEQERDELRADIAFLMQEYGESIEPMSKDAVELKERCRVLKERDELRARVEKLEAVAEAAREVIRKAGYELQLKDDGYSEIWVVPHEQIGKLARALGLAEKAK